MTNGIPPGGTVLDVEGLRVDLESGEPIVEDVSLRLRQGEALGLVGESGSGKTTTGLALLGYARPGARIRNGRVDVAGSNLLALPWRDVRRARGRLVSYVPQEPGSSLNPALRIGTQVRGILRAHFPEHDDEEHLDRIFQRVGLPTGEDFRRRFVHQLSGGQQQRVAIAIALVGEPRVVVLDEPTTGLDVVTQALILEEIDRLRREIGIAIVYVSHNLAVVASVADRIAVMYAGRIVEEGRTEEILREPKHPYTRGLIASVPDHSSPRRLHGIPGVAVGVTERPVGCAFEPRCPQRVARCADRMPALEEVGADHLARCFEWKRTPRLGFEPPLTVLTPDIAVPLLDVRSLLAVHHSRTGTVVAADDVSFALGRGESVALVGESGSGKTTIARCIAGLHVPSGGDILLDGEALPARAQDRSREARRRIQIVFQNPNDSLNPDHRVGDAIARPARILRRLSKRDAKVEARELLERVRLPAALVNRYPRELSGGERQRVAIARALAARPDVLLCDEVTSALDVSVQAAVIELLADLRLELGLSLLFISHDLGVVAAVSDRVLVLENGILCEEGPVRRVLEQPEHPYAQRLVASAPRLPAGDEVEIGAAER